MAVTKRTRFEVLRRDNFTCRYCRSAEGALTIDHVTPVALGGTDDPDNLVAACRDCNMGKGSSAPDGEVVEQVAADAERWRAAMDRAAEVLSGELEAKDAYVAAFLGAWPSYRHLPDSTIATVETFYRVGLPVDVMVDAAATAGTARGINDRDAYFAGICWKRVRAMQEIARQIVTERSVE